ncbi:MAG: L,D-transpeptidase [Chloroflexi bacterium]|nr:L,D-transpeptidase [Chloroflexota bacterium]
MFVRKSLSALISLIVVVVGMLGEPLFAVAQGVSPNGELGSVPLLAVSGDVRDASAARSSKWIEVRLASQRLIAWQNGRVVMTTLISSGLPRTPTVRGSFRIQRRYRRVRMRGPGYNLPNVPYAMFFYGGYALHGTYWHNNFGRPMSHGCVNLPTSKAAWLYNWASIGTLVVIH